MTHIDVFYQVEHSGRIEHLRADESETLAGIKARIGDKHGCGTDALIFFEEGDEPLDETATVGSVAGPAGAKLHVHRCRRVHVAVNFAGKAVAREFAPGTTVAHVKRWAAEREFGMSRDEAGEHVLQITGTHDRPAPGTHIGALAACPACRVAFDLVPDERVNG